MVGRTWPWSANPCSRFKLSPFFLSSFFESEEQEQSVEKASCLPVMLLLDFPPLIFNILESTLCLVLIGGYLNPKQPLRQESSQ